MILNSLKVSYDKKFSPRVIKTNFLINNLRIHCVKDTFDATQEIRNSNVLLWQTEHVLRAFRHAPRSDGQSAVCQPSEKGVYLMIIYPL
jgi:hypothetical protein